MKLAVIDGSITTTLPEIHDRFTEALSFPSYYGKNLDALYDCLSDLQEETVIVLLHAQLLRQSLDNRYARLLQLLRRVEEENSMVRVSIFE